MSIVRLSGLVAFDFKWREVSELLACVSGLISVRPRSVCPDHRKRPEFLSITHKLHSDHDAQFYVGESRHASPDHGVAGRRIVSASEIAT
jgi:hypothetical protein